MLLNYSSCARVIISRYFDYMTSLIWLISTPPRKQTLILIFVIFFKKDKVLCTVSTVFLLLTSTLSRILLHREFCFIAEALRVTSRSSAAPTVGVFDGSDFTAEPSSATSEHTGLNQLLLPRSSTMGLRLPLIQLADSQWLLPMLECLLHISSSFC